MTRFVVLVLLVLCWSSARIRVAIGQEVTEAGKKLEVKVETVLTGLSNPCGVAVRPGTDGAKAEVFVADSGSLRIIKMVGGEPGKSVEVVTAFPKSTYGQGPVYEIGPLGLAFLNSATLLVGGGGLADGEEIVRVYKLPEDDKPLAADAMDHSVGPIAAGDDSKEGEGNFYAIAVASKGDALFVSSNGDDEKGWILKATIKAGEVESLRPFIQTKAATERDAPVGLTVSPKHWLVVGQIGEITDVKDSLLTFYEPESGELKLSLDTGLRDKTALAYSPAKLPGDSRLYATDFAWAVASEGGLFRLEAATRDDGSPGCFANKLVSLDKPSAMAFCPDGTMYVAVFGTAVEGSEDKPGKLLKITGKFSAPAAAKK